VADSLGPTRSRLAKRAGTDAGAAPALTATTLLEEIQRRYPGQYENALLRTLQRRVRAWGASHGKEREIFFAQAHPPGRLGLSDFTHVAVLQVTIAGATLLHLLYQFALAYSGWRYVEVVLGGESFMALSSGLQNAAWMMGGVPEEHRTGQPRGGLQQQG